MKVIVLGAGIIGVLSAYFLRKEGFEVVVLERHESVAMESSFANGAQLSYSHAEPWASWKMLWRASKWIFQKNAPLLFRFRADPAMYSWMLNFINNCQTSKVHDNCKKILRLNLYSKKILSEILAEHNVEFDYNPKGILHIYTDKNFMDELVAHFEFQQSHFPEFTYNVLSSDECVALEPALKLCSDRLYKGIHCMQDATGDIHKFTIELEKICRTMGVEFKYDTEIQTLTLSNDKISGVASEKEFIKGDFFVASLGAYNKLLLDKIGINTPIHPLKGYSITLPLAPNHVAPSIGITDERKKLVYSKLGDHHMRISGTAEFAGYDHKVNEQRIRSMIDAYKDKFPIGGDFERAKKWSCLRPQTPSNLPIISCTKYNNLFINGGHGTLGWTMGAGSAKLLVDLMLNRKTYIENVGYSLANSRF